MRGCWRVLLVLALSAPVPLQAGELKPASPALPAAAQEKTATFVSSAGEELTASYDMQADTVKVRFRDGSTAVLPRALSGSGARYADDRMVFWEHQGTVSVWIDEKLIFQGAAAAKDP